jgi:putative ABC transport system permease protein
MSKFYLLKITKWLISKVTDTEMCQTITEDLEYQLVHNYRDKGIFVATILHLFHLIITLTPLLFDHFLGGIFMFNNYIKIIIRNFIRQKLFSVINIVGLSVGLACVILITLWIYDELSYDNFHEKADRIYRVVDSFQRSSGLQNLALSSAPFAPIMKQEFPEIEEAGRFMRPQRRMVEKNGIKFYEDDIIWADASIFKIFTLPLLSGNIKTVLLNPNEAVVAERIAKKYFGKNDPINEGIIVDGNEYIISGVMKNMPSNSHFNAEIFLSMVTLENIPRYQEQYFTVWYKHEFYTYLLLREGFDIKDLKEKLPGFVERNASVQVQRILGVTMKTDLQSLKRIHLHSQRYLEIKPNGDINYVIIFSTVAIFVLLIACFNYVNLSTALVSKRSKEVGLRKTVGACPNQLFIQTFSESFVFTFISSCLALLSVSILLPYFNNLSGKTFSQNFIFNPQILIIVFWVVITVSILSGSYPAFLLSKLKPANILKGSSPFSTKKQHFRKALVIFQFAISSVLIIFTFVVSEQIDFIKNKKLGFDKENVLVVPIRSKNVRDNYESIKSELVRNPNIVSATVSIGVPGGIVAGDAIDFITPEGQKKHTVRMYYTDHDFIKTMKIKIIKGRDFSKAMITDSENTIIVNEALVNMLQLENPLQTNFVWGAGNSDEKRGTIIGVAEDFQYMSLKSEINPVVIQIQPTNSQIFAIRVLPENIDETIKFIRDKWETLDPSHPFEYHFADESINKLYLAEEKMGKIMEYMSILAIFIAAMGLFGIASFMITKRVKEIGIRKVVGASVPNIIFQFWKEFTILVLIANIIAWPVGYFLINKWLQNFAFQVNFSILFFIVSALMALGIALITVSYQTIKAALSNPVDSLKYE